MARIVISKYAVQETKNEAVRLDKEAREVLRRLQRESGLRAAYIVCEILKKVEDYVEFTEAGDVQVR